MLSSKSIAYVCVLLVLACSLFVVDETLASRRRRRRQRTPPPYAINEDACRPMPGLPRYLCTQRIGLCKTQHNIDLKWGAGGCKDARGRRLGDGGCQCQGYCGYSCLGRCNEDPECEWRGGRLQGQCYVKATGEVGVPIGECGGSETPTAAPVTQTPSMSPIIVSLAPTLSCAASTLRCPSGTNIGAHQCLAPDQDNNPNGCVCLAQPDAVGDSRGPGACMQYNQCESGDQSWRNNICAALPVPGVPGATLPDPDDPCFAAGGACLKSCCSETEYICYQPCDYSPVI